MQDETSYDGTEQTPQPKSYRPPPMHPSSRRLAAQESWNHNFSFSLGGTATAGESAAGASRALIEESLPSVSSTFAPPSPFSRPGGSLLGDHYGHGASSSRQQPPMAEVRLSEENDADTFFECFGADDDRSLLQRTRRSLGISTTGNNISNVRSSSSSHNDMLMNGGAASTSSVADSSFLFQMEEQQQQQQPSALEVSRVHESALQALLRLKEELVKCHDRNKLLLEEQDKFQQQQSTLRHQVGHLQASLEESQSQKSNLEHQVAKLTQERTLERQEMEQKLQAAAKERKDWMHRKLATENRLKELRHQLQDAQTQLEESKQGQNQLTRDYAAVQTEKQELLQQNAALEQQLERALKEVSQRKQNNDDTEQRLQTVVDSQSSEITALQNKLAQMQTAHQQECNNYQQQIETWKRQYQEECEKHVKQSPRNNATTPIIRNGTVRFQEDATYESSVAERLARMRDSAERAHLIKAHKRELARLQLQMEEKLQQVHTSHQGALKEAQQQADEMWKTKWEEFQKSLQKQHQEELREVEERHRETFAELQKEYMRHQESSDKSLQTALTKISSITQQYEREVSRRASLELSMQQLHHDMEQERRQVESRHEKELAQRREEWENERDTLLAVIQQDCNSAFEQHWSSRNNMRSNSSPAHQYRSSPVRRNSPNAVQEELYASSSSGRNNKLSVVTTTSSKDAAGMAPTTSSTANLISPTYSESADAAYSEIDEVLRETEDLIQSIM